MLCGAHGGTLGAPCDPCRVHVDPLGTPLGPIGRHWILVAPFRSFLAPFGRIVVTFVEGLGDFLEAFPRQMEICTYVLEFFLSLFPFSALPVPLLRQVFLELFWIRYLSQIHNFHKK